MTKKKFDPREPMKRAIARELGLEEIIDRDGWGGLTSAQAGKIGGIMAQRYPGIKQKEEAPDGSLSGSGQSL